MDLSRILKSDCRERTQRTREESARRGKAGICGDFRGALSLTKLRPGARAENHLAIENKKPPAFILHAENHPTTHVVTSAVEEKDPDGTPGTGIVFDPADFKDEPADTIIPGGVIISEGRQMMLSRHTHTEAISSGMRP